MAIKLNQTDLDFILAQLLLPGNDPRNDPFGSILSPFGIRDVQGVGNNVLNPTWGAADQIFPRLTTDTSPAVAQGTLNPDFSVSWTPTGYDVRNVNLVDTTPRTISNLVSNQDGGTAIQPDALSELQVQDDPASTPGGRLSPLTGNTNPLPYASYMTFFGQFFDHGLDFVHKGADGMVLVPLLPGDPLYQEGSPTNFMIASRTNTVNVTVGEGSTDSLVAQLGLSESATFGPVTGTTTPAASTGGTLVVNGILIDIATGATLSQVADALNAQSMHTNVLASVDGSGHLVLTPRAGESVNTVSPFIDLSQAYGSAPSHTVFLREYNANGETTGALVSEADGSMPTWATIQANAARLGITLHDYNVNDIPLVRLNADGTAYRDANGQAWLVAQDKTTGAVVFVQDTAKDALAASNLVLVTIGHAFLDDMAHDSFASGLNAQGDLLDPTVLDAHLVAGDGRANENIALTGIHEVFHSEHNTVLEQIKVMVAERPDAASWTTEMYFQAAKLVTEMEYQHLVFGEFARKLSPNVNAFAGYDVSIDAAITAEFAHAVYRFGHSMLTDTVAMEGFDANGVANGQDNSMGLIEAFLNPTAFSHTVAGEVAIGSSKQVGYAIDEWVTGALRNNLVGLPLDLATLNIVRGRDAGIPTLNEVRQQLFDQTGMTSLKAYTSWDDFGLNLLHPESLKNFIAAYSADAILTQFATQHTLAEWKALQASSAGAAEYAEALALAADAALDDLTFLSTDQGFQNIDLWLGGLAEAKVAGGMLGSTFDFIFATQMVKLQGGDRFYYLERLAGTDLLAEIEGQLFSDLVMRNTGVKHLYSDIFSVADNYVEMADSTVNKATITALQRTKVAAVDADGVTRQIGTAGFVAGTFYGNMGDYLDGRGVLNPNGKGNASEMIGGTDGADTIKAMGGNDTVWGDGGNDNIDGGSGNDFLHGGTGDDVITDTGGDDLIWGDAGNDTINAGDGADQVFGGEGNDTLHGGLGPDVIDGGAGDDVIYGDNRAVDPFGDGDVIAGGDGNDTIYGGGGADTLDGGNGDDVLNGGTGTDKYIGGFGDDLVVMDGSQFGFGNVIDGGDGHDVVDYSASRGSGVTIQGRQQGISVTLGVGALAAAVGVLPADAFTSVEEVIGSQYDDTIVGGNQPQTDAAGNPIPNLAATPTVDPVTGALVYPPLPINWTIDGGAGNDYIEGGPGSDTLRGGTGSDTVSYAAAPAVPVVDPVTAVVTQRGITLDLRIVGQQNTVAGGLDTISGFENVVGTLFDDTIIGDGNDNSIEGLSGADLINAGAGNDTIVDVVGADTIDGGTGTDRILLRATSADLNTLANASLVNVEAVDASTALAGVVVSLVNQTEGFSVTGSALADTITGTASADVINGGAGDDIVVGVVGADTVDGGAGTDAIRLVATSNDLNAMTNARLVNVEAIDASTALAGVTVNLGNQTEGFAVTGSAFVDNLTGGSGNDTFVGVVGGDTVNGGNGTDTIRLTATSADLNAMSNFRLSNVEAIDASTALAGVTVSLVNQTEGFSVTGSAFADNLTGGSGDDTFVDVVGADTVNGGNGTDTIRLTATSADLNAMTNFRLSNVEAVDASTAAAGVTVSLLNQTESIAITGSSFADTITGTSSADVINAGAGDDTVVGVVGADTVNGGAGTDSIRLTATSNDLNAMSNARLSNVESIDASTAGSGVTVSLANQSEGFTITGSAFGDTITGSGGDDTIVGIVGTDTVDGGNGIDTIRLAATSAALNAMTNARLTNVEAIDASTASAGVTVSLVNQTEGFAFTGSAFADTFNGTAAADTIVGVVGDDTIDAGGGTDTIRLTATSAALNAMTNARLANVEVVNASTAAAGVTVSLANQSEGFTITGSAFADTIGGGASADVINAGGGDDVIEGVVGADTIDGGAGTDAIRLTATSANLNALSNASLVNVEAIDASTAAAGVTVSLVNQSEGFIFTGSAFADTFTGTAAADTIVGVVGDDTIDAGGGTDTIRLTATSAALNAMTNARLANVEVVNASTAAAGVTVSLANQSEGFTITGSAFADTIGGSAAADVINAGAGDDVIVDVVGADTIDGGAGTDAIRLTATSVALNALANGSLVNVEAIDASTAAAGVTVSLINQSEGFAVTGSAFADTIFGTIGNDALDGGLGADEMRGGAGDDIYVFDNAGDRAFEVAFEGFDTVISSFSSTLRTNLEKLVLTGTDRISGTGNADVNELVGNDGNNRLDGRAGADTMSGGQGNDVYVVDDAGDTVVELAGQGTDTVQATIDYTLGANVERLTLMGSADINGGGNELANVLTGNGGANRLDGGLGADSLTGGAGGDTYAFTTALGGGNVDKVVGFVVGEDMFNLDQDIFTALSTGQLTADAFNTGRVATDADDRILFDTARGALYYDADGAGGTAAVQFATVTSVTGTIDHTSFFII